MSRYTRGQQTRVSAAFRVGGIATDPTTVTVRLRRGGAPVETILSPVVVRDGVGAYHVDLTLDVVGRWRVRFEGDAPAVGASETSFVVGSDF
jgi:hypothetical protein